MGMLMKMAELGEIQTAYGPIFGIDNYKEALKRTEKQHVGKVIMLMEAPERTTPRTRDMADKESVW